MPSDLEIRERQKRELYTLLVLRKANPGIKVIGLNNFINQAKVGMSKEDIADVEKQVEGYELD